MVMQLNDRKRLLLGYAGTRRLTDTEAVTAFRGRSSMQGLAADPSGSALPRVGDDDVLAVPGPSRACQSCSEEDLVEVAPTLAS